MTEPIHPPSTPPVPEMTEAEALAVAQELQGQPPFFVQIDAVVGFYLVSMLQLALRHPANDGGPARTIGEFARGLQGVIAPAGTAAGSALEKGWDAAHDAPIAFGAEVAWKLTGGDLVRAVTALMSLAACMATGPGWTADLYAEVQDFAAGALRAAGAEVPPMLSISDVRRWQEEHSR